MQLTPPATPAALLAAGVVLLASACSTESPSSAADECPTSTAAIQKQILEPQCGLSGCHEATDPAQGLDLVSPNLDARVAGAIGGCGRPIVTPRSPSESYLLTKVSHRDPSCGSPMPLDRTPLSEHDVACLTHWIEQMEPAATDAGSAAAMNDAGDGGGASVPMISCATGTVPCGTTCIPPIEPELDAIYVAIFKRSCVFESCHGGTAPKEHLLLDSASAAFESLVDVPSAQRPDLMRVDPSHPELSYLVHKLRGTELGSVSTTGEPSESMPLPPNKPLCETKISAIEEWIRLGAVR